MITLPNASPYLIDVMGALQPPRPRVIHMLAYTDGTTRYVTIIDGTTVTRSTPATFEAALFTIPAGFAGRLDSITNSNPNSGLSTSVRFNSPTTNTRTANFVSNATVTSFPATPTGGNGLLRFDADLFHLVAPLAAGDELGFTNPSSLIAGWSVQARFTLWPTTHAAATRSTNIASATPTIIYTVPEGKIATLAAAGNGRDFACTRFSFSGGSNHRVNYYLLDSGETTAAAAANRIVHSMQAQGNGFGNSFPFCLRLSAGQSLAAEHISGPTTNQLLSLWHLEDA